MDIVITLLEVVQAFWRIMGFVEQKYQHLLIFCKKSLWDMPLRQDLLSIAKMIILMSLQICIKGIVYSAGWKL